MIVLDASVLIAYLDTDDALHTAAETLFLEAADDDLAVNSLTLAEVLVGPIRRGRLPAVRTALGDLEISELALPAGCAVELAHLRSTTRLRLPDCCVLFSAGKSAATLATFNDGLANAAEARNVQVLRR